MPATVELSEIFSRSLNAHLPLPALTKLQQTSVLVAGLGGGSNLAELLARKGVGHLIIADPDIVECHNIRQRCCTLSTYGQGKTMVMLDRLLDLYPQLHVTPVPEGVTRDNVRALVAQSDYVFDMIDFGAFHLKAVLYQVAREAGKIVLTAPSAVNGGILYIFSPHPDAVTFEEFFAYDATLCMAELGPRVLQRLIPRYPAEAPHELYDAAVKGTGTFPLDAVGVDQAAVMAVAALENLVLDRLERVVMIPKGLHVDVSDPLYGCQIVDYSADFNLPNRRSSTLLPALDVAADTSDHPTGEKVYTKPLTPYDQTDLLTYVQSTVAMDEAMFFMAYLAQNRIDNHRAMIFGAYNDRGQMVGALLINGDDCHVIWTHRRVLPLFAETLRQCVTTVRISGPTALCGAFLEHFSDEEIAFEQAGTTCVLSPQTIRPVRLRPIRCATLADVAGILMLEQRVQVSDQGKQPAEPWRHAAGYSEQRQRIISERVQTRTAFIGEHNEQTVAVAYADVVLPQAAQICEVATAAACRNQGFGSACVATLCQHLFTRTERIFLTYADDNDAAARAYQKIGFLPYAKRLRAQLVMETRRPQSATCFEVMKAS